MPACSARSTLAGQRRILTPGRSSSRRHCVSEDPTAIAVHSAIFATFPAGITALDRRHHERRPGPCPGSRDLDPGEVNGKVLDPGEKTGLGWRAPRCATLSAQARIPESTLNIQAVDLGT